MNRSLLETVQNNLHSRWRNALSETVNELIPDWCQGFQDVFWDSDPAGQEIVRLWYSLNKGQAVTRTRAYKLVYGHPKSSRSLLEDALLDEYLTLYPAPYWLRRYMPLNFRGAANGYYVRSEVERLRLTILGRLEREKNLRKVIK